MVPTTGFEPVNRYGEDLESTAFGQLGYVGLVPQSRGWVKGFMVRW